MLLEVREPQLHGRWIFSAVIYSTDSWIFSAGTRSYSLQAQLSSVSISVDTITNAAADLRSNQHHTTWWPKKLAPFLYALTLPNINRFSLQNQEKVYSNTITKDPTTPQACRYTTLWNFSVLKATIENKTTSVTTHLKKLTTENNVFIVSVIV